MKTLAAALLLIATAAGLAAHPQVRLEFGVAADFAEKPSLESVRSSFDERAGIYTSVGWEVIPDRIGFGVQADVLFSRTGAEVSDAAYDWWLDWSGEAFLSYHLFGDSGFDPYFAVGFGNAGRVDLEDAEATDEGDVTNLSLYPFIGAGLAVDLRGLLLGARAEFRPIVNPVPATQFADYPLTTFQVTFYSGFSLGGH